MNPTAIIDDEVAGDDFTWVWDSPSDLSLWDIGTLEMSLRAGPLSTSQHLATVTTVGSGGLDVPATVFASSASILSGFIVAASTIAFDPQPERSRTVYLSARCNIDGRLTTFMPATPFLIFSTINT